MSSTLYEKLISEDLDKLKEKRDKKSSEYKDVQTRFDDAKLQVEGLKEEIKQRGEELKVYNEVIRHKKPGLIRVTDHAIVRFLERWMELDMQQIKDKIMPKSLSDKISTLGNGRYHAGEHVVVVQDKTVVTVLPLVNDDGKKVRDIIR